MGLDPRQVPRTTTDGPAGLPLKETERILAQELGLAVVVVEVVGGGVLSGGSFVVGGRGGGDVGGAPVYCLTVSVPVNSAWQRMMLGFPHESAAPL